MSRFSVIFLYRPSLFLLTRVSATSSPHTPASTLDTFTSQRHRHSTSTSTSSISMSMRLSVLGCGRRFARSSTPDSSRYVRVSVSSPVAHNLSDPRMPSAPTAAPRAPCAHAGT
ncbi:hypothetical protein EON66_07895 [archaeon]|nr:MAG: hypothetical protein EON66_07895 [archaeon]